MIWRCGFVASWSGLNYDYVKHETAKIDDHQGVSAIACLS
jgi:hypothetical protein